MVCVPAPATEGSKVPLTASVIPVPDHVPPASTAERLVAASLIQKGPAADIVASVDAEIFTTTLEMESGHPPTDTVY